MATQPLPPGPAAAHKAKPFTRASSPQSRAGRLARPRRFNHPLACTSRPSADLVGRSVGISAEVPAGFDAPLAEHHKMIGRWVVAREGSTARYTRDRSRAHIEHVFSAAVLEILAPFKLADLRVVALAGDSDHPPAIAVICDSVGQIDLGWIEKSNVLSTTMFEAVAPLGWRATAYKALVETLHSVLPVFSYHDLFDEIAAYYWEGETDDDSARRSQVEWHGADPDEIDEEMLPSAINARRPDWMLAENACALKHLPSTLRARLRRLREAHRAVKAIDPDGSAWRFELDAVNEYLPGFEDCSHLPPLTLVPFDQFARELDDVAQHGMQQGFMDVTGLCALTAPAAIDTWFASLKVGAELLLAAQDLIDFDPSDR